MDPLRAIHAVPRRRRAAGATERGHDDQPESASSASIQGRLTSPTGPIGHARCATGIGVRGSKMEHWSLTCWIALGRQSSCGWQHRGLVTLRMLYLVFVRPAGWMALPGLRS